MILFQIKMSCLLITFLLCFVQSFGYDNPNTIYLLKMKTDYHQASLVNDEFYDKCKDFYDIRDLRTQNYTFESMQEAIKKKSNVINLNSPNYYEDIDKIDSYVNSSIIYAGKTDVNCERKCEKVFGNVHCTSKCSGKLMTKNAAEINSGDLLDVVSSIQVENGRITMRNCSGYTKRNTELKTVIICTTDDMDSICFKSWTFLGHPLRVKTSKDCKSDIMKYRNNLLAVIAPKPFEIGDQLSVPTIFYKTPYFLPEYRTNFPNSVNLNFPWWLLKIGFLEVIKVMNWKRVGIVSDDSEYSLEFEKHLVEIFQREGISFTVEGCESNCDFARAIKALKKANARIVIANVEEKHKHRLLNEDNNFTWLTRDWTFEMDQHPNQKSISITLGPENRRYIYEFFKWDPLKPNNDRCSPIFDAFNRIDELYAMYTGAIPDLVDTMLTRSEYYGNVTNVLKSDINERAIVYVYEIGRRAKLLTAASVEEGSRDIKFEKMPFSKMHYKPVDVPNCLIRSNNFYRPCDDIILLYLMVVIVMLFTTALLIMCFFDKSSPFMGNYNQFR